MIPAYKNLPIYKNIGTGTGQQKNFIKGPSLAAGNKPHVVAKVDANGVIPNYTAVYRLYPQNPKSGFAKEVRVDLRGKPHTHSITKEPIPVPHVQGNDIKGNVRAAIPKEIPIHFNKIKK